MPEAEMIRRLLFSLRRFLLLYVIFFATLFAISFSTLMPLRRQPLLCLRQLFTEFTPRMAECHAAHVCRR